MNWDDSSNQAITLNIEVVLKFIENAIEVEKGQVFVHCAQGVSRSGAIVCAYLMKSKKIPYPQALALAKKGRSVCQPNYSFEKQLKELEIQWTVENS